MIVDYSKFKINEINNNITEHVKLYVYININ